MKVLLAYQFLLCAFFSKNRLVSVHFKEIRLVYRFGARILVVTGSVMDGK